nr:ATP-dependent sacrificial sulfur transferase LarE [uncultured Blautia sp.]
MVTIHDKYKVLQENLKALGSVAVAFSSGVDSTFLLKAAQEALGDKVIAVTASSCSFPKRELEEAKAFCEKNGIRQIIVESEELDIDGFRQNPKNRCYLCKHELFEKIWKIAKENGMNAVAEGSNMDDNGDYRPGLIAVKELGVSSPLRQAELSKAEIRELSREMGLPTWDKQSFACLSSRFVYGETINEKKLGMVDKAEQLLLDMGFHQVRVRIHGNIARIEVLPEEIAKIVEEENRMKIASKLKEYGFDYVTLDLLGYRTGSMNETLEDKEIKK